MAGTGESFRELMATASGNTFFAMSGGEISELLSAASLEKMHAAVPEMKSVTVRRVGHAPMLDEPEAAEEPTTAEAEEAPKPKKKTRRGSRGGRNRKKKPTAATNGAEASPETRLTWIARFSGERKLATHPRSNAFSSPRNST